MSADPTRADYIAALRAIADFFEATPELPVPKYTASLSGSLGSVEGGGVAAIEQAAAAMGVPSETLVSGENIHHRAERTFGPIELGWSFVEFGAAKSIPDEGGEVAGPVEGSGSATAPTESAAGGALLPADEAPNVGTPESGGASAAVPAPVATGDGAAVTPDVWVPIRRRGTNYHRPGEQRSTTCGRNMFPNGVRLSLAEALVFGAVPCPRCYGGVR